MAFFREFPEPLSFTFDSWHTKVVFVSPIDAAAPSASGRCLAVADENTRPLAPSWEGPAVVLPPGEENKTFFSLAVILDGALEAELSRDSVFLALGGGVVCDLTALAASIYMRGAGLVLVPTTLLAMVDASLGGKTGVDFAGVKNLAGTFYPAAEVRICPEFLASLPAGEYRSGLAELIKHALLKKTGLFEDILREKPAILGRDPGALARFIRASLVIKGEFVEKDPREENIRAFLNLGHTFGHALESLTGFDAWSHGDAVAWGIARAMDAGVLLGITPEDYARRVKSLLADFGYTLNIPPDLDAGKMLSLIEKDKKKKDSQVRFVLQSGWGENLLSEVPREILLRVLAENMPV